MMRLVCKPTVRFKGFTPALLAILGALDRAMKVDGGTRGVPDALTITAGSDSHTVGGHVRGEAVDVRTKDFADEAAKRRFTQHVRALLGPPFFVDLESLGGSNEHLHIQLRQGESYDP